MTPQEIDLAKRLAHRDARRNNTRDLLRVIAALVGASAFLVLLVRFISGP